MDYDLIELLYVSSSLIPQRTAQEEVKSRFNMAQSDSTSLGITGLFMFSGIHFLNLIEGPAVQVDLFALRIQRAMSENIGAIVSQKPIDHRRYSSWSLGYCGPSVYIEGIMRRALHGARTGSDLGIANLALLIKETGVSLSSPPQSPK